MFAFCSAIDIVGTDWQHKVNAMHRTRRHSTKPRARIQVLRCADEILKRRTQGESVTDIHGDLQDRAEIDVRLRVFTLWVGRLEDGELLTASPSASASATDRPTYGKRGGVSARNDQRRINGQQPDCPSESDPPSPTQEPKVARLGVPILPAPSSEPDCAALFGEKE